MNEVVKVYFLFRKIGMRPNLAWMFAIEESKESKQQDDMEFYSSLNKEKV